MHQIKTFNAIAPEGMERFETDKYAINESSQPEGILLRSRNLHDYELPESVLAIARAGAGTNNIPITDCTERGIVVFNTPGANANAVKELVLTSLLLSVRPIIQGVEWVSHLAGKNVEEEVEANKKQFAGSELEGKRLGVIGLGAIGAMVANDAYRLGMEVVGYDPYVSVDTAWSISRRVHRAQELSELLTTCDFITVHVPLQEKTYHLIGAREIAMMKTTAKLFNFARGGIVDNKAVIAALDAAELAGYTTDFIDADLLKQKKVRILPHLGASTKEAETNCAKMAAGTLKKFLEKGTIKNSVNFPTVEMAFHSPYRITIVNRNVPNMLGQISSIIADSKINIENMINRGRDQYAYTLVDIAENQLDKIQQVAAQLRQTENIIRVRVIKNENGEGVY